MIYAHLNAISTEIYVGKTVAPQEIIGAMGTTGNSSGVHLHWEGRRVSGEDENDFGKNSIAYTFNICRDWQPYTPIPNALGVDQDDY